MNVADLKLGSPDALGVDNVSYFYARKPPDYAVYRTENVEGDAQRVLVHFSDSTAKADDQRKSLAQLAPARGEIAGLIDDWRSAPERQYHLRFFWVTNGAKLRKKAERYDRGVGDALIVALEGDLTGAGEVLESIKQDILADRTSRSRFQYLLVALTAAAGFIALAGLVSLVAMAAPCQEQSSPLCFKEATDLWRGAIAGAFGSFFSIALSIRGRTIRTDLNRTSNVMDAVLRVTIGIIAGGVVVALIVTEFVRISIGDSSPDNLTTLYVAIAGFVAGFTERLVPDLLAKAEARTGETPVLRRSEAKSETNAKETAQVIPAAPAPSVSVVADPLPDQAHEDACVADVALNDDDITPDESLPPASGGIARIDRVAA